MPSGPKKRRAARRRRDIGPNGEEEEFDAAGEISASINNESQMVNGDMKVKAVDGTGSKESQSVDQIALESPHTVESEHVEKSKDVPVLSECDSVGSNGKRESVHEEIIMHAAVTESVITTVEPSDSVGSKEKESESVDQNLIRTVSKETKGDEDAEVGEGAIHIAMEIVDHGFSVVKESEEISKEVVLQDPIKERSVCSSNQPQPIMVDTVDQLVPKALPLQEGQNLYVPNESVSEVNVETFIEDAQDSPKETLTSSFLVDVSADHEGVVQENGGVEVGESVCHGSSTMVKDVSVMNEGEEMSVEGVHQHPLDETSGSYSHEPQEIIKTIDILDKIRIKEARDPLDESVIDVDVDAISFEDAQDSFETPLGSPSMASYMSQVIPLNEAQDPNLTVEFVNEVNVETSIKDALDSFKEPQVVEMVDVSPVGGDVQGNKVNEGGESVYHDSPHVEPVLKVDEEISMESVLEEPLEDLFGHSLHDPVKTVDESFMEAIPLGEAQDPSVVAKTVIEANVDNYSKDAKDSSKEPVGSICLTDVSLGQEVVQGNVCVVGECACDCALINHVVSKGEKMSLEGVREDLFEEPTGNPLHEPQETVRSPVEGFVQLIGHGNKLTGQSLDEKHDDVTSIEGVVLGRGCAEVDEVGEVGEGAFHVSVLKEDEDMPIEGVVEEPSGRYLDELQAIINTLDQYIPLEEDQDIPLEEDQDHSIPCDSVSESNVETSLKNVSRVEGNEFKEVGESATLVNPFVLGMEDDEEMSIDEGVLEEPFEKPIEPYSDELQTMVKMVDSSVLEVIPTKDVEDSFVLSESLSEKNVETFLKDAQDSFKEPLEDSFMDDVSSIDHDQQDMVTHVESIMKEDEDMSMEDVLEEPISRSSDEPQLMVKRPNQDHSTQVESVIEVNVDASFEVAQDSFPLGYSSTDDVSHVEDVQGNRFVEVGDQSASHGQSKMINSVEVVMKEDEEVSMKGVLEETFEEPVEQYSPEPQTMVETINQSVVKEAQDVFVPPGESVIEVNVWTTFIEGQDSFEEKFHESATLVNQVELFMEDNDEMSIEGVLEEPFKELIGSSTIEPEIIVTVDQSILKEAQDPSKLVESGSVIEVNIETSLKETQDHILLDKPSMVDVLPTEGVVKGNEIGEIGESEDHGSPAMVNHVVSVVNESEEMSMEGVLQEPFEEPITIYSHEPQEMVKTIDLSVLKGLHLKETQDPFVLADSVIKVNVDTSFENVQDSFATPLGSPSVGHASPVDGFSEWNEPIGDSSHDSRVMVKTVDHVVSKVIPLEETLEPSLLIESVIEANLDTPLKNAKNHASMESSGSLSMADVSSMEGVEVGERSFHGEVVSIEDELEEHVKEPNEPSSNELQTMVKTVDQSVQVSFVPSESDFKANVQTSTNDTQDSHLSPVEGVVQERECGEGSENATIINHVESLKKENEDLSIKGVIDEIPVGDSSHEEQAMVDTKDRSLPKDIPSKEAEDSSVPVKSFIEVNIETSFKDAKESVPIESPSQVDVFSVGGIVQGTKFDQVGESGSRVKANHGSSSLVNGSNVESVGQRNGQRNDMVGLVRSLLEEIRRIRAFYEEGLRQTTQIDSHILGILEKFDSDGLI